MGVERTELNVKSKILNLVRIFYELTDSEHGLTMNEIIDELKERGIHSERKSIYRDLAALNECGFIISTETRNRKTTYRLINRVFSDTELRILADAAASSRLITEKQSKELVKKIEGLGSRYIAGELSRSIFISDRPKTVNSHVISNIGIISEAIRLKKRIAFDYLDWDIGGRLKKRENGDKKDISPCFLELSEGNYYLIAIEGESESAKHYRVDKMSAIRIGEEPVSEKVYRSEFSNPALYSSKLSGMFSGREESIRLKLDEKHIGLLFDHFGAGRVKVLKVPDKDGSYTAVVDTVTSSVLYGWLFGISKNIKLVGPPSVLEEYRAMLNDNIKGLENGD